ncbi:MAG TPA: EamA family transporter [Patescibacteria group bacterium]|nr:EamA family transporter [Patescibacteria group bacterium]
MMTEITVTDRNLRLQIIAALLAVYFFWGGTYLAMKIAIDTIPPFLMSGLRFFTAGLVVYLWEWRKGSGHPGKAQWLSAAMVGGLLLVCAMGGLVWAEQFVPSGTAAIIFATVPLWMTLIAWAFQSSGRPRFLVMAGLALGFCGVILLVKNSVAQIGSNPLEWLGYIVVTLAAVSWAWGSLYSRTANLPTSPFLSVAMQNLTGGACYLLISFLAGEWTSFSDNSVSWDSALALAYLIVFGSLIGFSAYIWLLKAADPTLVSTYAYANPIVAVFLGWLLAGEQLATSDALAAAMIIGAIIMITKSQSQTG